MGFLSYDERRSSSPHAGAGLGGFWEIMRLTKTLGTGLVVVGGLTALAGAAWAQDGFRETVVVTGAAAPVTLATSTRTVTVITRDEIRSLPVASVADLLRLVPSVDVRARGIRGGQTDFAVRGAGFGQVLVLVDGVRLNDAQSGHHNGDIPVPLDAIDRIEVLHGPGSSLYGADASGGAINIITRRTGAPASFVLEGGSFDLAGVRGRAVVEGASVRQSLDGGLSRSSGFMFDRDFESAVIRSHTEIGAKTSLTASFLRKEFGANNFYGPSPSREWTNQTLVALERRADIGAWALELDTSYRSHGDRFVYRQHDPAFSDNRHRTHEVLGGVRASRAVGDGMRVTVGAEAGGGWIRSSNLGDHETQRISGFGEWRVPVNASIDFDASVRVDSYTEFGTSWNPSMGFGWWPAARVRVRASAGRAFRVPTFTERYYSDPAHRARADIGPETAWSGEVGADLFPTDEWMVRATVFGRADSDVIDWQRETAADRWQTFNVRNVDTVGIEIVVRRAYAGGFVQGGYTGLGVSAAEVTQLSKYVLDYAPHVVSAAAVFRLTAGVSIAPQLAYKHRTRSGATSDDVVVDVRVSRDFGGFELRADGMNLFDTDYEEIAGVAMPGATLSVSLAFGAQ